MRLLRRMLLGWLLILAAPLAAQTAPPAQRPGTDPVVMRDNVAIPMRDGANLRAMIAFPAGGQGRWPVILTITPYQRDGGWGRAKQYARAGFVFVAIDSRGRGDSDGTFEPWLNDGQDGYDAVEWIARQPWSDGNVGMWGSSYGGFNQWATAAQRPPHLKSIMPAAAGLPAVDFPMNGNMMRPYAATWLGYVSGRTGHNAFFGDMAYHTDTFERLIRGGKSQADLAEALGVVHPAYAEYLNHPMVDDFWRARAPTAAQYAGIDIPVLSITGQWDGAQSSSLEHWRRHLAARPSSDHYLILGPYDHGGTRFPSTAVGGLTVAANGVIDMFALDLAWFDWTLRGGPKPAFLKDRVAHYVIGPNEWRYGTTLPEISRTPLRMWLDGDRLADRPGTARTARYRNDPADFTKFRLGTWLAGPWLIYKADVEALNGDGLVYTSAPLAQPLTLAGRPVARLPLAITTPDADFRVRLYVVAPDGGHIILAQDRIRARYRQSLERADFPVAGRRYLYNFDRMTFFAREIPAGHRLRLVVDTPNSVFEQRNFNAGGVVARETIADARAGDIMLFEGGREGAQLELPIVR